MSWRIKNWAKHQHFKDRTPPWIKLYREILDDPDWHDLDGDSAKILVSLWLIASEDDSREGRLPDERRLAFRLRITEEKLKQELIKLSGWLIQVDINTISERHRSDAPETERETYKQETKTEADCPSKSVGEEKKDVPPAATPAKKESVQGKRLPDDWKLPKAWGEWALEDNPALTAEDVRKEGEKFRNHWVAKAGKDARKLDWKATWANWIRSDYVKPSGMSPTSGPASANWFLTSTGIEAKGVELGLEKDDDELFPYYKARVYAAAGITEDMVRKAQNDIPRQAR